MALPSDSANPSNTSPHGNPMDVMDTFSSFSKGVFAQMERMIQGVGQAKQGDKNFQYNALLGHLNQLRNYGASRAETYGADIANAIKKSLSELKGAGGANAAGSQISSILNSLGSALNSIIPQIRSMGGNELGAQYIAKMSALIGNAASGALQKGDVRGIKSTEPEMTRTNFLQTGVNNINAAISDSANKIFDIGNSINDASLKRNIDTIATDLMTASDAATTTADKLAALNNALAKVEAVTAATQASTTATSNDKAQTQNLKTAIEANNTAVKKDVALRAKGLPFMQKHAQFLNTMRGAVAKAQPVMAAVGVAKQIGEKIHDFIEQGSSKQIKIASERAKYGRYLYGTNIAHGDLIGAVGTGRRAGLQDSEVISMLGDMGKQLAAARWGEGGLAEKAGRWGISIWDEQGKMLNQNQLFAEMSRTMNAMKDKEEKLQFLYDMGYGPEKFEFFENYERDARRNAKRRRGTRGILEDAEIFDESGMNRRIDAYTQMVFKRREIEKQNAYMKDGLLGGMMNEYFNPEYWFLPNARARQQGLAEAKSETSVNDLTKALRDLTLITKQDVSTSEDLSKTIGTMSADALKGLSVNGGFFTADWKNKGSRSNAYYFSQAQGGGNWLQQFAAGNGGWNGAALGAAEGGAMGALIGSIIPVIGTALGAGLGALGGGLWGFFSSQDLQHDFGRSDVNELTGFKTRQELEKWNREHGTSLTWEQVQDRNFDANVISGSYNATRIANAQKLVKNGQIIDPKTIDLAADALFQYETRGMDANSAEYRAAMERAIARSADTSVGRETAIQNVLSNKDIAGTLYNAKTDANALLEKQARLLKENPDMDKTTAGEYAKYEIMQEHAMALLGTKEQVAERKRLLDERYKNKPTDTDEYTKESSLITMAEKGYERKAEEEAKKAEADAKTREARKTGLDERRAKEQAMQESIDKLRASGDKNKADRAQKILDERKKETERIADEIAAEEKAEDDKKKAQEAEQRNKRLNELAEKALTGPLSDAEQVEYSTLQAAESAASGGGAFGGGETPAEEAETTTDADNGLESEHDMAVEEGEISHRWGLKDEGENLSEETYNTTSAKEIADAIAGHSATEADRPKDLRALGKGWFKTAGDKRRKADEATLAMETNIANAEAAAQSGLDAQKASAAEASGGEGKGASTPATVNVQNTLNITVNGDADPQAIAKAVDDPLKRMAETISNGAIVSDGK